MKADSKADKTQTDSPKKIPRTTRLKDGLDKTQRQSKSRFQGRQDSKMASTRLKDKAKADSKDDKTQSWPRQDSKIKRKQIPRTIRLKAGLDKTQR